MLKRRITEQYGLKVPFVNADMAFIATAPLVRAVCKAGGWECWALRQCPPTCCKRRSARSKQQAQHKVRHGEEAALGVTGGLRLGQRCAQTGAMISITIATSQHA
jgi:NAD(P)H-dependent flavin oxidoreductase YrpB (nitropropane dioxygenase family)